METHRPNGVEGPGFVHVTTYRTRQVLKRAGKFVTVTLRLIRRFPEDVSQNFVTRREFRFIDTRMAQDEAPDQGRDSSLRMGATVPVVVQWAHSTMPQNSAFRTTSWSLILAASADPTADSRQALTTLCQTYWNPVYTFIRRHGHDADQTQDLTQEFFARLIEKNYLDDADRRRGRFRSFLLTCVKHFLANEWDRERALKRGGGQIPVPIDVVEAERWYEPAAADDVTPERLFERRWALSLLERVMDRLRAEFFSAGKAEQFEILNKFLNQFDEDYAEIAARTGQSAGSLRMSVMRMRRKYRRILRSEIAQTVETPEEIDEEIRFLLTTLSAK